MTLSKKLLRTFAAKKPSQIEQTKYNTKQLTIEHKQKLTTYFLKK